MTDLDSILTEQHKAAGLWLKKTLGGIVCLLYENQGLDAWLLCELDPPTVREVANLYMTELAGQLEPSC